MASTKQPTCANCGAHDWQLEILLQILMYASGDDAAGPFKRETTADSIHRLRFWCDNCGDDPTVAAAALLEATYRSCDPLRAASANQGDLIATLDDPLDEPARLTRPTRVVRQPSSTIAA